MSREIFAGRPEVRNSGGGRQEKGGGARGTTRRSAHPHRERSLERRCATTRMKVRGVPGGHQVHQEARCWVGTRAPLPISPCPSSAAHELFDHPTPMPKPL